MSFDITQRPLLITVCPGCERPCTGVLPMKLIRDEHNQAASLHVCARCNCTYTVMLGTLLTEAEMQQALQPEVPRG